MGILRDIFGNLGNNNVQGNADDKSIFGERPEDGQGNAPKDVWGNEATNTSTEEKPDA